MAAFRAPMDGAAPPGGTTTHYPETRTLNRSFSNLVVLLSLLAVGALSTTASAQSMSASGEIETPTGRAIHASHIRRGPGPRFGGLWWIDNGERVTVTDRRGGWVKI